MAPLDSHEGRARTMDVDPTDATTWPELMTVDQAATVLRMTPKNVRNLLDKQKIAGTKKGGRWYVLKRPLLTPDAESTNDADPDGPNAV